MEISELRMELGALEIEDDEMYWEAVSDLFIKVAQARSLRRRAERKMADGAFRVVSD